MKKIISLFFVLSFAKFGFSQTANFTYSHTCFGSQTILSGASTLADTAVAMWQWDVDGDSIYDFKYKLISYFFTAMDSVAVKLKITPNFSTPDSITKFVLIHPLPNVNFRADNLCALSAAKYINMSSITSCSIISASNLWDFNHKNMGLGGNVISYQAGIFTTLSANINYTYHAHIAGKSYISLGLGIGMVENHLDLSSKAAQADPFVLSITNRTISNLDASFGISFLTKNIKLGITMPSMLMQSEYANRTYYLSPLYQGHAA